MADHSGMSGLDNRLDRRFDIVFIAIAVLIAVIGFFALVV